MSDVLHRLLNPIGEKAGGRTPDAGPRAKRREKPIVGLLNNSKPNVSHFLAVLQEDMRSKGFETVSIVKPRSAAPCPDAASLANQCDYVINAVAD
jgi:hypothetical protein